MKVEIEPKSAVTKTMVISKKKIYATAKEGAVSETQASKPVSVPNKKLVLKQSSVQKSKTHQELSVPSEKLVLKRTFVSNSDEGRTSQEISAPNGKLVFKKPPVSNPDKSESSKNISIPHEKSVLKESSVSISDNIETPKETATTSATPKNKKLKLKKSIKIILFAICAGSVCGLVFAGNVGRNSFAVKNNSLDTELSTTETISETETTLAESPTETSAEPTTETTTIPAETDDTPFIDYNMKIDPSKPMIALTYDDGPAVGSTEKIIDVLKEYHAHATFFLVGNNITEETEKILQKEVEAGCEIGNHTLSHQNLEKLDTDAGMSQLKKCDDKIYRCVNRKANLVRPPYGAYDDEIREADKRMFIYWSLDTSDWKLKDADKIYDVVMEYISDGDIVLLHDIHEETAEATERLIPDLIDMGYQLVTVSELMYYRDFASEDGMVLFNVHPDMPLYHSLYGTVCEHEDMIQTSCYEEDQETTEFTDMTEDDIVQTTTEETSCDME